MYESLLELVPRVDLEARTFRLLGLGEEKASAATPARPAAATTPPNRWFRCWYAPPWTRWCRTGWPAVRTRFPRERGPPVPLGVGTRPAAADISFWPPPVACRRCWRSSEVPTEPSRLWPTVTPCGTWCPTASWGGPKPPGGGAGSDRPVVGGPRARTALSFLDHLVCGDSLLGILTPEQIATGVPGEAFKALSGDHQGSCADPAGRNASALRRLSSGPNPQRGLFVSSPQEELAAGQRAPEALGDDTPDQVVSKEGVPAPSGPGGSKRPGSGGGLRSGAFLLPKTDRERCPTTQDLLAWGQEAPEEGHRERLRPLPGSAGSPGPPLAPGLPRSPGPGRFRLRPGNPWERIKLQEQEFFASRHPDVALASNSAERTRRIAWLARGDAGGASGAAGGAGEAVREAERRLFMAARRTAEAASLYAHLEASWGAGSPPREPGM